MKSLNFFTLLFFLGTFNSVFTQTIIDGLKEKNWYISSTQFNDKSYVVNVKHATEPEKIIFFDKNGNQTKSKTLTDKESWTFSNRPVSVNYSYKNVPIIDKENKLCYNLVTIKNKLSIQIVNENLTIETINLNGEVYSKFDGIREFSEMLRKFDSEGNPLWVITQNRRGFLYVKYLIKEKRIEHKFFEHEGYSNVVKGYNYVSAGLIGYLNDKIWYAQVTDRGHKKTKTEVTIFSIDDKLNKKEEHKISLNKSEKDLGMSVEMVDQNLLNTDQNMYFTLSIISANNAMGANSLYFIQCDGVECSSVQLEDISKVTNSVINNKTFLAVETPDNEVRFVLGDLYGNALAFDINFEEKVIANIKGVQLFEDRRVVKKSYSISFDVYDQYVFTSLLYEKNVDDNISEKIEEVFSNKQIPIVFKGSENLMYVISADYQESSAKFTTKL